MQLLIQSLYVGRAHVIRAGCLIAWLSLSTVKAM